ncbi:MAG: VOC family protein [Dermatophilaceae bacterium]
MTIDPTREGVGRFDTVVLDCPDPRWLAEFYAGLLGQGIADDGDDAWQSLRGDGTGVKLAYNRQPTTWPPAGRTGHLSSCTST